MRTGFDSSEKSHNASISTSSQGLEPVRALPGALPESALGVVAKAGWGNPFAAGHYQVLKKNSLYLCLFKIFGQWHANLVTADAFRQDLEAKPAVAGQSLDEILGGRGIMPATPENAIALARKLFEDHRGYLKDVGINLCGVRVPLLMNGRAVARFYRIRDLERPAPGQSLEQDELTVGV